jgi:hypothetical protein
MTERVALPVAAEFTKKLLNAPPTFRINVDFDKLHESNRIKKREIDYDIGREFSQEELLVQIQNAKMHKASGPGGFTGTDENRYQCGVD